jgi:hypothetical protein
MSEWGPGFLDSFGNFIPNVHTAQQCVPPCPIHAPSDHHMREWELLYRFDRGIFERICPHAIGHPDPDSVRRRVEFDEDVNAGLHGCDGCCHPPGGGDRCSSP